MAHPPFTFLGTHGLGTTYLGTYSYLCIYYIPYVYPNPMINIPPIGNISYMLIYKCTVPYTMLLAMPPR